VFLLPVLQCPFFLSRLRGGFSAAVLWGQATLRVAFQFLDELLRSQRASGAGAQASEKGSQAVILSEAKNLCSCKIKQLQRSFVVPIRSGLLSMTVPRVFPQPVRRRIARPRPVNVRTRNLVPDLVLDTTPSRSKLYSITATTGSFAPVLSVALVPETLLCREDFLLRVPWGPQKAKHRGH